MSFAVREYTIPAGHGVWFNVQANAFTVLHADKPVLVAFDNGTETERVEQGLSIPVPGGFDKLRFENRNETDVFIRIGFNDQAIIDSRLSVSAPIEISGFTSTPTINVIDPNEYWRSLCEGFYETGGYQTWAKMPKHKVGGSWAAGVAGVTPQQIVNPAFNTAGVILRQVAVSNTGFTYALHLDTSAPANETDYSKRMLERSTGPKGCQLQLPMIIDPGQGLWITSSGGQPLYSFNWDYLP